MSLPEPDKTERTCCLVEILRSSRVVLVAGSVIIGTIARVFAGWLAAGEAFDDCQHPCIKAIQIL